MFEPCVQSVKFYFGRYRLCYIWIQLDRKFGGSIQNRVATSDVNKDSAGKAKAKAWTLKAKA